jgi:membrane protease YdiL (CAAX protease family)
MDGGVERPGEVPAAQSEDRLAAELRGFGPIGMLAILGIVAGALVGPPLSAALVLLWAWRSRTPWDKLGFSRPTSWTRTVIVGIAFGITFKFAMKAIVLPLLGADPINQAYHYLAGNAAALPGMILAVTLGAGFGEELFFRSYLFERLGKLFGSGAGAKALIVLVTTTLFGAAHYSGQGIAGVQQATVVGLVFGTIFAITGRIWMLIFAHAAFDLFAVAIIYLDLETEMAHLVFK